MGPGNVEIAGQLRVGNFGGAPAVNLGPGSLYFDTQRDELCVFTAKSGWQCLSTITIVNVLINNTTFLQNIIDLLIQNNTFIQNIVVAVGGNVTFQQTILQQLIQSVEFRQTIINILIANVEFRQTIINLLVANEPFKTAVIEALLKAPQLVRTFDDRYVLKPRDESDLTIGSLFSLGQLAGDWLVVGEPKENKNFWALINPDDGPDLALGTVEPPNLSELKLSVLEFERASGLVRVVKDLEVGGSLTIKGSLTLEDLEVNRDLRVAGDTELEDLIGRDAEFDNVTVKRDLRVEGVKFFVQPHPTDPTKEIAYAALEGPEPGTYVRGEAELKDGEVIIVLPEHFALVTAPEGLTVQLTPVGRWLQLYVTELSPQRLVVREAQGKSGRFFYLVQGVRRGYQFEPVHAKPQPQTPKPK